MMVDAIGVCEEGYEGQACGDCVKMSYYRIGNECKKCSPGLGVIWLLSLVLLFGACLLVLRFARPDPFKINSAEIALQYLQLIAIFTNFSITWPYEVHQQTAIHHTSSTHPYHLPIDDAMQ